MRAPSAVVEAQLANCFEAWGRVVARHPCAILWSSIVFALILAGGITQIQIVGDAEQLWAVRDRGWRDEQFLRECCGRPATSIAIQAVRMGGGSIFEPEAMLEVLRVHEWVTQTLQITRSDGSLAGYAELCDRSGDQCSALLPTASLLGMAFNYSSSNVPSSEAAILMAVNAINEQWPIQQQVAEPAIDPSTGLVTSSRGIMLRYALFEFESEDDVTFALAVDGITPTGERTGTGVTSVADPALLEITHWSEAGIDVEFARTVAQDIPLFVVALNLVVLFLALNLGRTRLTGPPIPDFVYGRFLLAWMSITSVLLAVVAGFGVASVCGATFHSVIATMPLIALGVQVDDCIITINSLSHVKGASLEKRFATSLRVSGPCVTTTSLTTVAAFAIGTSAALPGVAYFCMFATSVFLFGWLFQVTFFYACIVLDERRIARSKDCMSGCIVLAEREPITDDGKEGSTPFQRLLGRYADVLLHPTVSLLVLVGFAGLTALACGLVTNITVGLPLEDVLPDDSYIRDAFATSANVFRGRPTPITVVVLGEDFNDAGARARFRVVVAGASNLSFAMAVAPHWMDAYEAWSSASPSGLYLDRMAAFLGAETAWQEHVTCTDAACTAIASAKFVIIAKMAQPGGTVLDELRSRDALDALLVTPYPGGNVVVSSQPYMFAESDEATWNGVLTTCCFALVGILGVCCCLSSVSTACFVTVCVAMIDIDLLLLAYAWDVRLNSISYVCLVMALGLAVDYCVHIGHAFDSACRDPRSLSNQAAAKQAVMRMGASVFQGGFTTLLGILVLALASSVAFRTLFRFVLGTVLLGIAHGVVLLPVLLTYLTPRTGQPIEIASKHAPASAAGDGVLVQA